MVNVETDQKFQDPRNPLIPVINPGCYTKVLRSLGMPDYAISVCQVRVSSEVPITVDALGNVHRIYGQYFSTEATVCLYPGGNYIDYLRSLALSLSSSPDRDALYRTCQTLTHQYHSELGSILTHETGHCADHYHGLNLNSKPTEAFLVAASTAIGSMIGGLEPSQLYTYTSPALGALVGLAAMTLSNDIVYQFGSIERRARSLAKKPIPSSWGQLVSTRTNPDCDLNHQHFFPEIINGSNLAISNRQILDLRAEH